MRQLAFVMKGVRPHIIIINHFSGLEEQVDNQGSLRKRLLKGGSSSRARIKVLHTQERKLEFFE